MGLFSWIKKKSTFVKTSADKEEKKKVDVESAKVSDVGKEEKGKDGVGPKKAETPKKEEKKQSMKELYGEDKTTLVKTVDGKKDALTGLTRGKKARKHGNAYRVLVKPLVTEKATNLGALNKYVFAVAPRANKIAIAKAINEVYGVKPDSVNVIKIRGKNVRYGRRTGKRTDWKKAVITLPPGKSINIYEGV